MILWILVIFGFVYEIVDLFSIGIQGEVLINFGRFVYPIYFLITSVLYVRKYRSDNLVCFELPFLIIYFLIIFFQPIFLYYIGEEMKYGEDYLYGDKSMALNMLSFFSFILGCMLGNRKKSKHKKEKFLNPKFPFGSCSRVISYCTLAFLFVLVITGQVSSWFHYGSSSGDDSYANTNIVYLTVLFLTNTVLEFSKFAKFENVTISQFFRKINKLYLYMILGVGLLLMLSGNRNESLLILLPPIFLFTIFIKKISKKMVLIGISIGWGVLALVGVLRQDELSAGSVSNAELGVYESVRDYAFANMCTTYLIEETDRKGPIYFNDAIPTIASGVPLFGGFVAQFFPRKYERSTIVTTDGILGPQAWSGLGTGLIGDLYYYGSSPFVVIYMFFFGWFISKSYMTITTNKGGNIYYILLYAFLFSNVLYCLRAEWLMPVRYIGFSFVILLLLESFVKIPYHIIKK